jgi:hypothetical protein
LAVQGFPQIHSGDLLLEKLVPIPVTIVPPLSTVTVPAPKPLTGASQIPFGR